MLRDFARQKSCSFEAPGVSASGMCHYGAAPSPARAAAIYRKKQPV